MVYLKRIYVPVRRVVDDGHEWLDIECFGGTPQDARANAEVDNRKMPRWSQDNPIVRIACVEVREVPD